MLKLTFACGTALVRPDHWLRTVGHRTGNKNTHLPSRVTVAVTASVMPSFTFLISVTVGGEAVLGYGQRGGGPWNGATLWR